MRLCATSDENKSLIRNRDAVVPAVVVFSLHLDFCSTPRLKIFFLVLSEVYFGRYILFLFPFCNFDGRSSIFTWRRP